MLQRNKYYLLSSVIDHAKEFSEQDDDFCIYGDDQDSLDLLGKYFVSDFPVVQDDKEIYPEPVQKEKLSYLYSGQQFIDVVTQLMEQKPDADHGDHVKALNYYQDNDDFISL